MKPKPLPEPLEVPKIGIKRKNTSHESKQGISRFGIQDLHGGPGRNQKPGNTDGILQGMDFPGLDLFLECGIVPSVRILSSLCLNESLG